MRFRNWQAVSSASQSMLFAVSVVELELELWRAMRRAPSRSTFMAAACTAAVVVQEKVEAALLMQGEGEGQLQPEQAHDPALLTLADEYGLSAVRKSVNE